MAPLRTYASKRSFRPSSPDSAVPPSSSPVAGEKRKRAPLEEEIANVLTPAAKHPKLAPAKSKPRTGTTPKTKSKSTTAKPKYTQLHFNIDQSVLRSCAQCGLSYNKGAPDDEALHKAHCVRVQKGMEWGREEERESFKAGVVEVATDVPLKNGARGRIVSFRADLGGKIGSKISTLLDTVNITLSAPALTTDILRASKVYLFLLPSTPREKIVGCVIAQHISTAMQIATADECRAACEPTSDDGSPPTSSPTAKLVAVDTSTGIFCHPKPLPTPLGIPRLFVPSTHRRQGVASKLLSAAAATFVYGCPLDPRKGQVAFTQPTGDGNAVMQSWGKGGVRIYEE
ncbi:zf-C2H2-3 domain-containing protein [Mycena chlorophos]|uniref:Zf-C2H2-3 domain-containing protein n=1 Tax=Mycena chlorophos TaxID=658473 RepID=A0A8H6TP75_MYCCL|nr:zf-C2H2-3 domain-containing protein [Mycena chlorophos]